MSFKMEDEDLRRKDGLRSCSGLHQEAGLDQECEGELREQRRCNGDRIYRTDGQQGDV
jgi:hypothetical protein